LLKTREQAIMSQYNLTTASSAAFSSSQLSVSSAFWSTAKESDKDEKLTKLVSGIISIEGMFRLRSLLIGINKETQKLILQTMIGSGCDVLASAMTKSEVKQSTTLNVFQDKNFSSLLLDISDEEITKLYQQKISLYTSEENQRILCSTHIKSYETEALRIIKTLKPDKKTLDESTAAWAKLQKFIVNQKSTQPSVAKIYIFWAALFLLFILVVILDPRETVVWSLIAKGVIILTTNLTLIIRDFSIPGFNKIVVNSASDIGDIGTHLKMTAIKSTNLLAKYQPLINLFSTDEIGAIKKLPPVSAILRPPVITATNSAQHYQNSSYDAISTSSGSSGIATSENNYQKSNWSLIRPIENIKEVECLEKLFCLRVSVIGLDEPIKKHIIQEMIESERNNFANDLYQLRVNRHTLGFTKFKQDFAVPFCNSLGSLLLEISDREIVELFKKQIEEFVKDRRYCKYCEDYMANYEIESAAAIILANIDPIFKKPALNGSMSQWLELRQYLNKKLSWFDKCYKVLVGIGTTVMVAGMSIYGYILRPWWVGYIKVGLMGTVFLTHRLAEQVGSEFNVYINSKDQIADIERRLNKIISQLRSSPRFIRYEPLMALLPRAEVSPTAVTQVTEEIGNTVPAIKKIKKSKGNNWDFAGKYDEEKSQAPDQRPDITISDVEYIRLNPNHNITAFVKFDPKKVTALAQGDAAKEGLAYILRNGLLTRRRLDQIPNSLGKGGFKNADYRFRLGGQDQRAAFKEVHERTEAEIKNGINENVLLYECSGFIAHKQY
jgi:hypothetical protein